MAKLLKILYNSILALVLVASAAMIFVYFGKVDILRAYIVTSGSMEPAVKTGSIVFITKSEKYFPGDVISFSLDGGKTTITHRLVFDYPRLITGGDANEDFDNWQVESENIIGKVVLTIPLLGYIANYAKNPQGFILLVIVPATIIIYEELKQLTSQAARQLGKLVHRTKDIGHSNRFAVPKIAIILPLIGALIFFAAHSNAFFSDLEESVGNVLTAATSFPPSDGATP